MSIFHNWILDFAIAHNLLSIVHVYNSICYAIPITTALNYPLDLINFRLKQENKNKRTRILCHMTRQMQSLPKYFQHKWNKIQFLFIIWNVHLSAIYINAPFALSVWFWACISAYVHMYLFNKFSLRTSLPLLCCNKIK